MEKKGREGKGGRGAEERRGEKRTGEGRGGKEREGEERGGWAHLSYSSHRDDAISEGHTPGAHSVLVM